MNIKFKSIRAKGFRSIDNINLDLDNKGIVIVKGINDYEATASSNGSGKSSIFEAIIYALFEETSSGEKDVANRVLSNGFDIILELEIDGTNYTIHRYGDKKTDVELFRDSENISARTKTDTNKLIIELLGINKDIFLDSIFLSQNVNTNLTSLTPSARKERLELLTSTNNIIEAFKERIKNKQLEYENNCVKVQMEISNINGKKEIIQSQIRDTELKINNIDEEIRKRDALGSVQEIENEIHENEVTINKYKIDIEQLDVQINDTEQELSLNNEKQLKETEKQSALSLEMQTVRDKYNSVDKVKEIKKQEICNIQNNIRTLEQDIEKIKNSDTCPTCGRKYDNINAEHLQRNIEMKQNDINKLNENINNIQSEFAKLDNEMKQYENELILKDTSKTEIQNILNEIIKERNQIIEKQKNLNLDKDNDNKEIQTLQNRILELNKKKADIQTNLEIEKEQLQKLILENNKKIIEFETQIQTQSELYTNVNNYVEVCKNAIQMITKDFRTFLLQNSIKYLNNLLEEYSKELFSNEKDVIKISDDNTKLNITLGNATYESLSGGEKTRVDIALLLAQKSLASTIGDISSNIIILDEILKFCDSSTEINVIDLIAKELDTLESIFMISHKEIPIGYDTQITIRKNEQGLSNLL